MYVLRITLVFLIIYLIVRAFIMAGEASKEPSKRVSDQNNNKVKRSKGVPKGIGEYIEYEETGKQTGSTSKT